MHFLRQLPLLGLCGVACNTDSEAAGESTTASAATDTQQVQPTATGELSDGQTDGRNSDAQSTDDGGASTSGPATSHAIATTDTSSTGSETSQGTDTGAGDQGLDDSPVEGVCAAQGAAPDPFADCIESFAPADGVSFGHAGLPDVVLGSPVGAPGGGTHVASLGCSGRITVFFDDPIITDGPGPDFIVFENPFAFGQETFTEPARVSVSDDGVTWFAFDCDLTQDESWPPTGCAGVTPVLATPGNGLATDPALAGGDAFDLADVGLDQARYVRLVDVSEAYYGNQTWCGGAAGGFDLDAVAIVEPAR